MKSAEFLRKLTMNSKRANALGFFTYIHIHIVCFVTALFGGSNSNFYDTELTEWAEEKLKKEGFKLDYSHGLLTVSWADDNEE